MRREARVGGGGGASRARGCCEVRPVGLPRGGVVVTGGVGVCVVVGVVGSVAAGGWGRGSAVGGSQVWGTMKTVRSASCIMGTSLAGALVSGLYATSYVEMSEPGLAVANRSRSIEWWRSPARLNGEPEARSES